MKTTLFNNVLKRELGDDSRYSKIKALYGDRQWVNDLDIVNELGGHSGCVNALSWSRSGKLLASGSDDQHINIHSYQPDSSTSQFDLTTTVATGHKANIFSVKFMPHSNDRILVSAAGDSEVRIFDIEYAGQTTAPSDASNRVWSARNSRPNNMYNARHLTDGNTNAKVFRSHSDRVKRIVTESSPWLFLTCSEDGEVRQWDIRQPSSAYPAAGIGGYVRRSFSTSRYDPVPPPLISYKRYHLDLNTISCSPSQPHYIALGGAHLHCFLHDRRMTGRDRLAERGASLSMSDKPSNHDDELFSQATQCVRKFAPNGQKRMKRIDNGHITACKISDANPNEMIVSWSGESIYSFDLLRSPGTDEPETEKTSRTSPSNIRVKDTTHRKRKRTRTGVSTGSVERPNSRPRTGSEETLEGDEGMALMVHYENGQSEEIPIETSHLQSPTPEARDVVQIYRIARQTVTMKKNLFTLKARDRTIDDDPTGYTVPFSTVLGIAVAILPQIDEIIRTWRYPVDPSPRQVREQNSARELRSSIRRFVQAAGTLARVMGGRLRTVGNEPSTALSMFEKIDPAPRESPSISVREKFSLDFLKAILLWLGSGVGALLEGFSMPPAQMGDDSRYPVPENAGVESIDEHLIPYLRRLASRDRPIINLDASPFEINENRYTFMSEKTAIDAFARAVKLPFADLSSHLLDDMTSVREDGSSDFDPDSQDRGAALRFWGYEVGRGLLANAGIEINCASVDRALGGRIGNDAAVREDERIIRNALRDIDVESPISEGASISRIGVAQSSSNALHPTVEDIDDSSDPTVEEGDVDDEDMVPLEEIGNITEEDNESDEDEDDEDDHSGIETHYQTQYPFGLSSDDEDDDDEDDDDDDVNDNGTSNIIWRSAFERTKLKEKAELDKPCSTHTRRFGGHCNVKTVKDVNFYGLQDEYVVSGSDSGHLFIWDKKTTRIVNILEGDGEVVNVVQGHPYEPVIAVSGIDHTVKIFSPDARARDNARLGIGVSPGDTSAFSSINLGRMPEGDEEEEDVVAPGGLPSRKRMADEYQIISENDLTRQGGNRSYITVSALFGPRAWETLLITPHSITYTPMGSQGIVITMFFGTNDPICIQRGMLAELAQRFYLHPQLGDDEVDEGGGPAMLDNDEQCAVM
ncbi:WD40 repeat-like protein [Saccharata proteae CBS 121410]|uniref:WD40 repeat-like protein n=1 Tax=Saccharata proteae CBS 121410 TaxID=1314787 RepID=A0A9P4HMG1_9PEZI|nr:WD40 repeat-like protein [Saccharata proteae CBS 121410]